MHHTIRPLQALLHNHLVVVCKNELIYDTTLTCTVNTAAIKMVNLNMLISAASLKKDLTSLGYDGGIYI